MVTLKKHRFCFSILTGLLVLSACVDNNYDLNNLNTDTIEVGEDIIVPLGTGSIEANKLLDTKNVKEIKVDDQGNYRVVYQNSMEVDMPTDMDITTVPVTLSANLSDAPSSTPVNPGSITLPGEYQEILNFDGQSPEIRRIDSVIFSNSELNLSISLTDYMINTGSADLMLEISFPQGFELEGTGTYFSLKNKHTLSVSLPFSELKQSDINFPLTVKKAVPGNIDIHDLQINVKEKATFIKNGAPELNIQIHFNDLYYDIVFGDFDINFNTRPSSINMGDFNNIFEGDNKLSFADPHIKLVTESNIGIPLNCDLSIKGTGSNGNFQQTEISDITIAAASPVVSGTGTPSATIAYSKWWIGPVNSISEYPNDGKPGGQYTFKQNTGIPAIIKIAPEELDLNLNVESENHSPAFFTRDAFARVNYEVEIPFAPALDFMATVTETIEDAFDDDLIEYAFSNGSATISGEILNSFPLTFSMNLEIMDKTGTPVGITFTDQEVKGSNDGKSVSSIVSYTIKEKDMPKMSRAGDIIVRLIVKSNNELAGKCVKNNQQLILNLRLQKSGGIVINND